MASKIIKGQDFPEPMPERTSLRPSRPGVVEAEVYEAHQRAKEIIENAEVRAAEILANAEDEREAALADAREAGRQEGLAQMTEILLRARQEASALIERSEEDLVRLALVCAEKIIGRALDLDPNLILEIAAQAIESVRQQRELVLRVHPEDALRLRNSRKKLMDLLGRTKDIAVREDPEIERGGCIIETENGTVDAQLSTQMRMLEAALLGDRR
ncbi:MAG: type III secretion system stator protein SctL [Myxococcales bacterium]|jgi:type III secretion protein L